MVFIGQGDWNDLECWQDADRLPIPSDNVIIASGAICYMPESAVGQYETLTIEDGAQLYAPEDAEIVATVKKNIEGYTPALMNNWYLLSFPVDEEPDFQAAGMITESNYDLFYFDQDFTGKLEDNMANGEWRNYKWCMSVGEEFKADYNAYLYANRRNTTLSFTGILYTEGTKVYQRIKFNPDFDQVGVNLIGNPYTCNAEVVTGSRISGIYMMNDDRTDVMAYDDSEFDYTYVAPMTAFFAVAAANNPNAKITMCPVELDEHEGEEPGVIRSRSTTRAASSHTPTMSIELTANGVVKDRVYLKAGQGEDCPKFTLTKKGSKIFVPKDNKNYAIAYAGDANEMPLSFTAKGSGTYTLKFNTKRADRSYLHLIDKATGADIDLLKTPSYTFDSNDSSDATRFKLVLAEDATK